MAAAPNFIPVEEYLRSSYRPDCDYIDGSVVERNLGQFEHSRLQYLILMSLGAHEKDWQILVLPEQRLKIREGKYRVPDVMVIKADDPRTPVIEKAPLLCIEIVSSDDRLQHLIQKDVTERARDYLTAGVPQTWIFDPGEKRAYVYSAAGLHEVQPNSVLRYGVIEMSLKVLDDIAT